MLPDNGYGAAVYRRLLFGLPRSTGDDMTLSPMLSSNPDVSRRCGKSVGQVMVAMTYTLYALSEGRNP